ncbi:hypothetical protein ACIBG0_36075 [Nocardia sp. NPDC050630]|uniref:hypothetical protein n=1 Tax=Nocardia sp. NPDC050630 TaxID=3364321 RepID=UPI0037892447
MNLTVTLYRYGWYASNRHDRTTPATWVDMRRPRRIRIESGALRLDYQGPAEPAQNVADELPHGSPEVVVTLDQRPTEIAYYICYGLKGSRLVDLAWTAATHSTDQRVSLQH